MPAAAEVSQECSETQRSMGGGGENVLFLCLSIGLSCLSTGQARGRT